MSVRESVKIFFFFVLTSKMEYIKHQEKPPPQHKVCREEVKSLNTKHN